MNCRFSKARVAGWSETSMVDVLGHTSFTVWFNYCNFRCPWCQNSHVVLAKETKTVKVGELIDLLAGAKGFVDYLHVTGGEPTVQTEPLYCLFKLCREGGYMLNSLDTNGSNPSVVRRLLSERLLDHVALDIKAPLDDPETYARVCGLPVNMGMEIIGKVKATLAEVTSSVEFVEVRTTLVPGLVTIEHIARIVSYLSGLQAKGRMVYVVQQFMPSDTVMSPEFRNVAPTPMDALREAANLAWAAGLEVYIRSIERGTEKFKPST